MLIRIIYLIALTGLLSTCTTPEEWSASEHRRQMMQCRSMCGKFHVRSYDPWTGECLCVGGEK